MKAKTTRRQAPFDEGAILVVVDPHADSSAAVERGAWLAARTDAPLELFICDNERLVAGDERARARATAKHLTRLRRLADRLELPSTQVGVDVDWSLPVSEGITRKVAASSPSIVVKSTHYRSMSKSTISSPTDWELIDHCPAPLMLVKSRPLSDAPRFLAAVDPMREHGKPPDLDRSILSFIKRLRERVGGVVHVMHAFEAQPVPPVPFEAPQSNHVLTTQPDLVDGIRRQHAQALEGLVAQSSIDGAVTHLASGDPVDALASCAEQLAPDFVVMGAVPRGGLKRVLVGHTAERAIDSLACDLIVVKPKGHEASIPPS